MNHFRGPITNLDDSPYAIIDHAVPSQKYTAILLRGQ